MTGYPEVNCCNQGNLVVGPYRRGSFPVCRPLGRWHCPFRCRPEGELRRLRLRLWQPDSLQQILKTLLGAERIELCVAIQPVHR